MNLHQIVSGACNAGDKCFAVGSVEGVPFTAYAAGCNIVILASTFERVQIIPGAVHEYVRINSIDCSSDTGKIAAAYNDTVCIYEPTPLIHNNFKHGLDYRWVQTGTLTTESTIRAVSWNLEGTRLLTAGDLVQLWHLKNHPSVDYDPDQLVTFTLGGEGTESDHSEDPDKSQEGGSWECVWRANTAIPVHHLAFSPDGTLFATCGENDRLVKIWYENKHFIFTTKGTEMPSELVYGFVYIAHPRAVTHISWRTTSKYMPKGSVSNMLVTSCKDNICRLWVETVLPEDGLVDLSQLDPEAHHPKFRTHRHKHRFMQRLKHMKTCFHIRRHHVVSKHTQNIAHPQHPIGMMGSMSSPIPTLPSTYSVHDFHSYGYHGTGVTPGLHFHLAASVNAESDIPLVPDISYCTPKPDFVLHWLDNKEMHFSLQAESLLEELTRRVVDNPQKEEQLYEPATDNTSPDGLDARIETLLRDWHHSPDLLFSIHPVDGSFLIWLVEWLDEYHPGSFRQAQVSFSTRIPSAFPLGDSMSMSTTVSLYSSTPLIKHLLRNAMNETLGVGNLSIVKEEDESRANITEVHACGEEPVEACPHVSLVTKHDNGTLNLWQLTFADKSKFCHVLSIAHTSRASGHRFRVNDIACHPVLPLLLTTSHHNIVDQQKDQQSKHENETCPTFCSELILWKVDAVGPLSKSGGICELARISSPERSAFSNAAWIPTLLPSTTLGNLSNSPSACFVASDGYCLRVYQAVIDARTLLADLSINKERKNAQNLERDEDDDSELSDLSSFNQDSLLENINIVSQQSTARPGCIIQLETITTAIQWQHTTFLHVYQEQLITGRKSTGPSAFQAAVLTDVEQVPVFEESFFIVLLDCTEQNTTIHTWKLTISSNDGDCALTASQMYVPDCNLVQDEHETISRKNSAESLNVKQGTSSNRNRVINKVSPHINIVLRREIKHILPVNDGIEIIQAVPAAGHLSSASIYPACLAPYCFATACNDGVIRFWTISSDPKINSLYRSKKYLLCADEEDQFDIEPLDFSNRVVDTGNVWTEWKMTLNESAIEIEGQILNISVAYSGRLACAYKYGRSFTRPNLSHKSSQCQTSGSTGTAATDPDSRFINLCVAIYECESTGGSEWVLEDIIHLKNIHLPRIHLDRHLDLSYLYDMKTLKKKQRINEMLHTLSDDRHGQSSSLQSVSNNSLSVDTASATGGSCKMSSGGTSTTLLAVPSFTTLQSLRKSISEMGNICPLTQKHLVQLDWVSNEDGSHILTVACGSKIMLYTPLSTDLAQANVKAMKESLNTQRPVLRKASSLAQPLFVEDFKWMTLRKIELQTADGLPALPMQLSWVRDGILVVGMDSEMHVYSQWKPQTSSYWCTLGDYNSIDAANKERDVDFRTLTQENQRKLAVTPTLGRISTMNLQILDSGRNKQLRQQNSGGLTSKQSVSSKDCTSSGIYDYMPDYGLFEASRIACPVLPQYHPKQLMELLNSGKIRWVKAILNHLVKCLDRNNQGDNMDDVQGWARSRTRSISCVPNSPEHRNSVGEAVSLDYDEISNIAPLPLWTLLAADKEQKASKEDEKSYNELFDHNVVVEEEESLDTLLEDQEMLQRVDRRQSERNISLIQFTPKQGRLLSRLLTHKHLPGLSSLDQMHLLALADTVSTCNTDLAERFVSDSTKASTTNGSVNAANVSQSDDVITESLDDCGLRFLLAMKHYSYLLRCLPLAQRAHFQKIGVGNNNLAWAYHSESQEELLRLIPSYAKGEPTWTLLRELGVGWWIRKLALLKQCVQVLAKAAYQVKHDPMDAAIYYIALNKKSLLWGLYRSQRDEKMTNFFSNNFQEDRWRKAALKNAYALLGKQRFDHAAAFFLLAGNLKDAIEVCLHRLHDLQLAIIITRLYDGDGDKLKELLYQEILGCDQNGENHDTCTSHPDPFLRSMAFWTLKRHQESLSTLLVGNAGSSHPSHQDDDDVVKSREHGTDPNVFNFYVYLRTHPLLIRQHIAASDQKKVWLPGGKQVIVEGSITPLERQLYFATAHGHFRAGCPALALEVLSKLPCKVAQLSTQKSLVTSCSVVQDETDEISTGILAWNPANPADKKNDISKDLNVDWSTPLSDYRTKTDDLDLKWSDDEKSISSDESGGLKMKKCGSDDEREEEAKTEAQNTRCKSKKIDIMAQQLKFVACLKILMEELSTLATGFEVDGGQLRYHLYIWLEKEVEALRELCSYSVTDPMSDSARDSISCGGVGAANHSPNVAIDPNATTGRGPGTLESSGLTSDISHGASKPTLHELLVQEKLDFEAKVRRAAQRKAWLRDNETLLRTLLSYCSLHGATGGLASVRMELVLLLQELQQEKTHQQLLSPLPFPTSLPLLAATVASSKTAIADPIRYLQSLSGDMLQTIVELPQAHASHSDLIVLRDLAIALSACIYQSLCDSDTFKSTIQDAQEMFSSHLVGRRRKVSQQTDTPNVITPPAKWPGVTSLRALLAREKDEDTPRLNVLLCEALTATYMALLLYGLATCDCVILYHVMAHPLTKAVWGRIFGGGTKKLLRTASTVVTPPAETEPTSSSAAATMWLNKQRVKLNNKLLGHQVGPTSQSQMKEDKPTYREQFCSPEMSILAYLLTQPHTGMEFCDNLGDFNMDSDQDSDEMDNGDIDSVERSDEVHTGDDSAFDCGYTAKSSCTRLRSHSTENNEHSDPNSYSWLVLRLAILKLAHARLVDFLAVAGLEMQELPVASPLIHGCIRRLGYWQENLRRELDCRQTPIEYIPGCFIENAITGPPIQKYRQLLETHNTPFSSRGSATQHRRLWHYLVNQELIQDIFIRAVFGKRRSMSALEEDTSEHGEPLPPEPVRIIHKEQDSIAAFSLNQVSAGLIVVATPRELHEMDISLLLELPSWLEDECELDILNLTKDSVHDNGITPPFLVIQSLGDKQKDLQPGTPQSGTSVGQSGRGTSVVLKHKVDGIRRISSHPLLALYLTGGQDGSVQLWEFGHQQPIAIPRPAGTYAKVTRVRFSQHGNKFGVADSDGNLSLFQLGLSANATRPFFTLLCHNKGISDFVFLGSCSLLATAGHSSESKNVCIWDSILPHGRALVVAFACHEQGASSLVFAPQHQVLISTGKKGDVCLIDVRAKAIRHKFSAHESSVKCIAIEPHEEYFATGSADGEIKIWGVSVPNVLLALPAEHARSSFFKNIGQGVTQLHIDSHARLYSCGADGSMKVRQLPNRDTLLRHLQH